MAQILHFPPLPGVNGLDGRVAKPLVGRWFRVYLRTVSTTALRIIRLVKSLPPAEQRAVSVALAHLHPPVSASPGGGPASFRPEDYVGLPDDDPFFKVMAEIEQERHARVGPPPPLLD